MTKDTLFVGHVHRQTLHLANDKLKFAVVKKLGLSAMVPPAKATTEFVLNCVIWPWPPTLTV